jgi:hypothetical protein
MRRFLVNRHGGKERTDTIGQEAPVLSDFATKLQELHRHPSIELTSITWVIPECTSSLLASSEDLARPLNATQLS